MTTNATRVGGDDLDRFNNRLQALALQQFLAGVEVTVVAAGDVHYIARAQAVLEGAEPVGGG